MGLLQNEKCEDQGKYLQQANSEIWKKVWVAGPEGVLREYGWVQGGWVCKKPS
jgi:hypothetical protein